MSENRRKKGKARRLVSTKGETGNAVNVLTFYGLCDRIRNVNQSKQSKIDNRAV